MAKPTGPLCNLDCSYCFYLEKENLYGGGKKSKWAMPDDVVEAYIRQYIEAQDVPEIHFAWQGGEPTLLGVDFFRSVVALQRKYANGKTIHNAFQTNGVLLDDAWGSFLHENEFLVGVSVDGPRDLHDKYRVDKGGNPTFDKVMRGMEALKRNQVEFNTLTCVQRSNSTRPLDVYRFLKDAGSGFMQFIPIVERISAAPTEDGLTLILPGDESKAKVAPWSVDGLQYGKFLAAIFDEWVRNDVGRVFVQMFDIALEAWVGMDPTLCVFAPTCGKAMALEHNGDLYSCDHFVYPEHKLGNIVEHTMKDLVTSAQQQKFGNDKQDTLPQYCLDCDVRFVCNGGCPKHRFIKTPKGEEGLNYFCPGFKHFFHHIAPEMRYMAHELHNQRPPSNVMNYLRALDQHPAQKSRPGPNDPCPCGSGKKYKKCCWGNA
ncbi:MAG: anaerobic sulfatase maturase [Candidatus Hydrogenedentes bacterium]|nr:anaerobic sulfatase maturase [Candidatus Hydrogenedentota bacterium]